LAPASGFAAVPLLLGRARLLGRIRAMPWRGLGVYALLPALSGANALVGLALPLLLTPERFGEYAIAVTLFQYGLIFDFGVAQLVDRRLPVLLATADDTTRARLVGATLWLRLYIAGGVLLAAGVALPLLAAAGALPFGWAAGLLSLAGGLGFMLALGPASVYRASSRRQDFAKLNAALLLVLAVARPVGMLTGGIVGCFAALAAGYGVLAAAALRRMPPPAGQRPDARTCGAILHHSLPMFLTSFVWAFYMTANRWVVSTQVTPLALGHFAFASNIVYLLVGMVGTMSQFWYPRVATLAAGAPGFAVSARLTRDMLGLTLAIFLPVLLGMVIGPFLIALVYPKFAASADVVQLLLVAVPSLGVATWLMPLSLSTCARPWLDGGAVYPPALAILLAATLAGERLGGIVGAGWGLVASAVPLLALQFWRLHAARLLRPLHAAGLLAAVTLTTAILGLFAA
jgi:O-antigen/teichoic acid export membrane protein